MANEYGLVRGAERSGWYGQSLTDRTATVPSCVEDKNFARGRRLQVVKSTTKTAGISDVNTSPCGQGGPREWFRSRYRDGMRAEADVKGSKARESTTVVE